MRFLHRTGVALFLTLSLTTLVLAQPKDLPKEFKQIIPRERIAAITKPVLVSATEAGMSDDSYVLGVVIDGHARAYSLNLLNNHEILNDEVGDTAFAAVW